MSLGIALGGFVGGAAKGYSLGLDIKERINKEKYRKKQAENIKTSGIYDQPESGNVANPKEQEKPKQVVNLADSTQQSFEQPMAQGLEMQDVETTNPLRDNVNYDQLNTPKMAQFAEGGRVDASALGLDYNRMAGAQPQQTMPQPTQQAQPTPSQNIAMQSGLDTVSSPQPKQPSMQQIEQSYNRGKKLKEMLGRMMDTAAEFGETDDAMKYFQASFGIEERMIKEALPMAQRQFAMTGDPSGFVKLYNDTYDDNHQITNYAKDADGNYVFTAKGMNGESFTNKYSPDDLQGLIATFENPQARWTAKQQAANERAKALLESEMKIKEKNSENFTLRPGEKRMSGEGLEIAKNDAIDNNINEIELRLRAGKGDKDAQAALKQMVSENEKKAVLGRAPREPKEKSIERQAYEEYLAEPANKGKGTKGFLEWKAGLSKAEGLDSVTTSKEIFEKDGSITKESRTSKVKPEKPQSAAYKEYLAAYEAASGNPEIQKRITERARANGVVVK